MTEVMDRAVTELERIHEDFVAGMQGDESAESKLLVDRIGACFQVLWHFRKDGLLHFRLTDRIVHLASSGLLFTQSSQFGSRPEHYVFYGLLAEASLYYIKS